jgi:hypothetical protein
MAKALIEFPIIYKDGELLPCPVLLFVDCNTAKVIGEKSERAWYPQENKYKMVTGFFIEFEGIEYGTINIHQWEYLQKCADECANCSGAHIHVKQWVKSFV